MRRNWLFAFLCGGVLLIGVPLVLWSNRSVAQPAAPRAPRVLPCSMRMMT